MPCHLFYRPIACLLPLITFFPTIKVKKPGTRDDVLSPGPGSLHFPGKDPFLSDPSSGKLGFPGTPCHSALLPLPSGNHVPPFFVRLACVKRGGPLLHIALPQHPLIIRRVPVISPRHGSTKHEIARPRELTSVIRPDYASSSIALTSFSVMALLWNFFACAMAIFRISFSSWLRIR